MFENYFHGFDSEADFLIPSDGDLLEKLLLYYTEADGNSEFYRGKSFCYVISSGKVGLLRRRMNDLFIFFDDDVKYQTLHIELKNNIVKFRTGSVMDNEMVIFLKDYLRNNMYYTDAFDFQIENELEDETLYDIVLIGDQSRPILVVRKHDKLIYYINYDNEWVWKYFQNKFYLYIDNLGVFEEENAPNDSELDFDLFEDVLNEYNFQKLDKLHKHINDHLLNY